MMQSEIDGEAVVVAITWLVRLLAGNPHIGDTPESFARRSPRTWALEMRRVRAGLLALEDQGMAVVPIKATERMKQAAVIECALPVERAAAVWRAMAQAAPRVGAAWETESPP